jgi:oligopeptide transport system ATP-binding protein
MSGSLLEIDALEVSFRVRGGGRLQAVAGVDLRVEAGEVLALVGESGSGKTTLGRCVLGLQPPTAGGIALNGHAVQPGDAVLAATVQPVFQDPFSSLDPRWAVGRTIREPLDAQRIGTPAQRERRVAELMEQVGLDPGLAGRLPRELSGGQRQRVAIAAALAPEPALVVADEPVSSLDMLVQAQVLNLLADLRARLGLALLFITHDLAVVRHLADRVAVMYLGRIVEQASVDELFEAPQHPYTQALLAAQPLADPAQPYHPPRLPGEIPSPIDPPSGCAFHPRCPIAEPRCREQRPVLSSFSDTHAAACLVAADRAGAIDHVT